MDLRCRFMSTFAAVPHSQVGAVQTISGAQLEEDALGISGTAAPADIAGGIQRQISPRQMCYPRFKTAALIRLSEGTGKVGAELAESLTRTTFAKLCSNSMRLAVS